MRFVLFFVSVSMAAQSIVCPAYIAAGSSGTCTSATSVTWSCSYASGTCSVSPSSGTSTTVTVSYGATGNQMYGVPTTPLDSVFNTPINNLPTDPNGATRISSSYSASPVGVNFIEEWGFEPANSSTPTKAEKGYYSSTTVTAPQPSYNFSQTEAGKLNSVGSYETSFNPQDHHSIYVNYASGGGVWYELYNQYTGLRTCNDSTSGCTLNGFVTYPWYNYNLSVGTYGGTVTAAGLPIAPLTLTDADFRKGAINHALYFTACLGCFTSGPTQGTFWRWPATTSVGGATGVTLTNYLMLGAWVRLKSSYTPGSSCSSSTACMIIVNGLKNHGMILGDTGSNNSIAAGMDVQEDPVALQAILTFQAMGETLNSTDWEVVDPSPLFYKSTSWQSTPYGSTAYSGTYGGSSGETYPLNGHGTNSYQAPPNQLIVTGSSNSTVVTVQPVTIGLLLDQTIQVLAAGETYTFQPWVNGSANQSVNYTISPSTGCGSMSGATYTAPTYTTASALASGCSGEVTITLTSAADSAATYKQYFRLLPSGNVCIDSGSTTNTTTTTGSTCYSDYGVRYAGYNMPGDYDTSGTNITGVYATQYASRLKSASDIHYNIILPAGQYLAEPTFVFNQNSCGYPFCSTWPSLSTNSSLDVYRWANSMHFETQGNLQLKFADFTLLNANQYYTPATYKVPALVVANGSDTGGLFDFGIFMPAPDINWTPAGFSTSYIGPPYNTTYGQGKSAMLSMLQVVSDSSTSPHVVVDTAPAQFEAEFLQNITGNTTAGSPVITGLSGTSGILPRAIATVPNINKTKVVSTTSSTITMQDSACSISSCTGSVTFSVYQPQGVNTIHPGQTLQPFYLTDYYTGLNMASAAWSIVSGPSGASFVSCYDPINTTGQCLQLVSGSYINGQAIVVKGTISSYSAYQTITITNGGVVQPLLTKTPAVPTNHYNYVISVTVNHSLVSAAQSNFPVLVSITNSVLASTQYGGNVQNPNGYDIVFASNSSGTPTLLNWEIESYNPQTGNVIAWVKLPSLSATANTSFYMFYDNPTIFSKQNTPSSVWDSNFNGVYHLASLSALDSTSNARNATSVTSTYPTETTGQVDGAILSVYGSANYIALPSSVMPTTAGSVSMWISSSVAQSSGNTWKPLAAQDSSGNRALINMWGSSDQYFGFISGGGSTDQRAVFTTTQFPISTNTYYLVTYTWDSTIPAQHIYLNGAEVSGSPVTTAFSPSTSWSAVSIGADTVGPGNDSFGGILDEFRFSNIQRSASWIATEYASESSPSTFTTFGSPTAN